MTDVSLVDRLAALPRLAGVPRGQLEWLAAHGELRQYDAGEVMFSHDQPPPGPYVILSGRILFINQGGGVSRILNEMHAGGISGRLPYSRMTTSSGALAPGAMLGFSRADEPVEILLVTGAGVRDMARECYDFTALCVHEMIDRTRLFKSADLQREKMASLGRLAAGLAHELNNPSSAVARSAREMDACRADLVAAARDLGAAGLDQAQASSVAALEALAGATPDDEHAPMARSDREEALETWLDTHGLDSGLAERLIAGAVRAEDLDPVRTALTPDQLPLALRYVASGTVAARLTREIENAATRIHALVAAVKKHTHMDRAPEPEPIDLRACLSDTLTLVGAKARNRSVTLSLDVAGDLPPIRGFPDELNEVWLNLVDNAIDAAPDGGAVTVSVARDGRDAVVGVTDDGPGISEEDQAHIFEPFFTTKPVGQGTGLGLDVVQSVVRSHGGRLGLTSRPGKTTFTVALPPAEVDPAK